MGNNKKITLKDLYHAGLISVEQLKTLEPVNKQFALSITPQMWELILKEGPEHPIAKQFIPNIQELTISPEELPDPIGDEAFSPVKGIVRRYPDRCLLKPVLVCPVYCRFCFRREKLGANAKSLTPAELKKAYQYIAQDPELWEVIITGGDPLILKPNKLQEIISALSAIPHVEVIRIHTRIPVVDSNRITEEMLQALKTEKALYIALHADHPSEFTELAIAACKRIINAGIPMISQTVLLKGINDNIETLSTLMRTFVKNKIKPYYLHHGDLVRGTSHFRTSLSEGQALMKALGRYSGLCKPTYVLEIPGGYGKVPVGHSYCIANKIEDYEGQYHEYPQL
jgi:lysine 2,3-aminomutase